MKIDIDVADLNDLIKRLEHVPENVEQAASRALERLRREAVNYALKFSAEENERTFWIGCSNFRTSLRLDDRGGAAACWRLPPDTHNVQIILGNSAMMDGNSAMMEIGNAYRPGGTCSSEISGCRRNKLLSLGTLHGENTEGPEAR